MSESATQVVMNVIQRVYEDANQTTLDREAASQIIAALRERGWASFEEVALLIEAAGGSITVPDDLMASTQDRVVERYVDHMDRGIRFSVRTEV